MSKTLYCLALVALLVCGKASASDEASGKPLGRLFLTPGQRNELEARKKASPEPTHSKAPEKLEGFVRRSSGHSTIWLDGRMIHDPAFRPRLDTAPTKAMNEAGPAP